MKEADFTFENTTGRFACYQCRRWSQPLAAWQIPEGFAPFMTALEHLTEQNWQIFITKEHRQRILCPRCQTEWPIDRLNQTQGPPSEF